MRWPWSSRKASGARLVVAWSGGTLAYARAKMGASGQWGSLQLGVERQGTDSVEVFADRLQALGFKGMEVHVMLRSEQCQILQVDAPAVAPEEMRAAARYQIRDMVETHIDDITLDVFRVGDGQQKGTNHLFVVVATNAVIRGIMDLARTMQWTVPVIDIKEMALRNLQAAVAARNDTVARASAALVVGEKQAFLTITANEELFYTRRLELPEGFMAMDWNAARDAAQPEDAYTPVSEYVPDYAGGGLSAAAPAGGQGDAERAQRFLVEVQRSLDLWDRTNSNMPLTGLTVLAGERSAALAQWLTRDLGQTVGTMDVAALFPGFPQVSADVQIACAPLLGILLRNDTAAA